MDNTIPRISAYQGVPGARHTVALEDVPRDAYLPGSEKSEEGQAPKKKRHLLRKLAIGAALTTTALGAAGVGGAYVASHAPICNDPAVTVAVTDDGLCVSRDVGLAGSSAWRILSGIPHLPGAVQSQNSDHNQVFHPAPGSRPPAPLMESGHLRVVTYNLHHGRSPDSEGAREQVGEMVGALRDQKADSYLLQEVDPNHVDDLVNGTGMVGYYSQTTIMQGNLLLVHPDLPVTGDSSTMLLNGDGSALGELKDWALHGGGQEPRSIQTVEVKLPDGRETLLWNTHQPTDDYTDQQKIDARAVTMQVLDQQTAPGELAIGGGDMNAGADGSLAGELRQDGYDVNAFHIDFINAKNAPGKVSFDGFHLTDSHGVHLSDHPMGVAEIPV